MTQVLYSTCMPSGQKAGYSIKKSSLPSLLYLFPLKSISTYAVLARFFLFHCWHLCCCPRSALFMNMQFHRSIYWKSLSAFCVERKLINSRRFQHAYGPGVQQICHREAIEYLQLCLCELEGFVFVDFVSGVSLESRGLNHTCKRIRKTTWCNNCSIKPENLVLLETAGIHVFMQ